MDSESNLRLYTAIEKFSSKTFFNYILEHERFSENYKLLLSGLSREQQEFLALTVARALAMHSGQVYMLNDFTPHESAEQAAIQENFYKEKKILEGGIGEYKGYKFPADVMETSLFYYEMGLEKIQNKEKLKGLDFIDAGAYGGDSALILNRHLNPRKIYCFEPITMCHEILLNTILINDVKDVVIPVKMGLGSKVETKEFAVWGAASGTFLAENFGHIQKESVKIDTIDNFVQENSLNIGLIKIDVEGYDLEVLRGAENTIKRFKPLIIGSIYHNAEQFFEFKPIIQSWDLGYKFFFDKTNPNRFLNEINVICEVY